MRVRFIRPVARRLFLTLLGATASLANGETLAPDSLLCEDHAQLQLLVDEEIKGPGANELLRQADLQVRFHELTAKQAGLYRSLAQREEQIRADSRSIRLASGSTSARAAGAAADESTAEAQIRRFRSVLTTCAGSGASPLPVEVTEAKAISGVAKIKVSFRGGQVDLWTYVSRMSAP